MVDCDYFVGVALPPRELLWRSMDRRTVLVRFIRFPAVLAKFLVLTARLNFAITDESDIVSQGFW